MTAFLPFFIILLVALVFSALSYKLHLPWVVAVIVGGMLIGPDGLGIFQPDNTFEFLGQVGLVFLMFMAGIETRLSKAKGLRAKVSILAIFNSLIPFLVGITIGYLFGYSWITILLIGIIFMSSSIAVIVPTLQSKKMIHSKIGRTIVGGAMIEDVLSLILISILLQTTNRLAIMPLVIFYPLLLFILFLGRKFAANIKNYFSSFTKTSQEDIFQRDVRTLLVLLIGSVVMFEILGLHAIIAGFFAGFILSDAVSSDFLMAKLRALGYGLFIPIFFVLVGTKTDLNVFSSSGTVIFLTVAIIAGSMFSKFISGYWAGRISGFSKNKSALMGSSTIPQLSTTLAVAFTAAELNILDAGLLTAIVSLSVVTTFTGPLLSSYFSNRIDYTQEI